MHLCIIFNWLQLALTDMITHLMVSIVMNMIISITRMFSHSFADSRFGWELATGEHGLIWKNYIGFNKTRIFENVTIGIVILHLFIYFNLMMAIFIDKRSIVLNWDEVQETKWLLTIRIIKKSYKSCFDR